MVGTGLNDLTELVRRNSSMMKREIGAKAIGDYLADYPDKKGNEVLDSPDNIKNRLLDLYSWVKVELKRIQFSVNVDMKEPFVKVSFQKLFICGIEVQDEVYKIYNVTFDWAEQTSYLCEKAEDGSWYYFLETIDECIGEIKRLVAFEANKGNQKLVVSPQGQHNSELSKVLNRIAFERSFAQFIKQADDNVISGKGAGGQTPFGFAVKPYVDGADVSIHYGQGSASKTPYLNWWVVSIYYVPDNGNITIGIEETRYPHLKKMRIKPVQYSQIGNKKDQIAVFYSTTKANINYIDLYENFLNICEEVMRLGIK